jgi:hypothetical protein
MSSNGHGWQNRIVEYGVKRADQFQAHPRNWRTHPKHQRAALAASLGGVGWVDAVTENAQTGHLIDGHERIWQALEQGDDTPVPFIAVNLTEDEELLVLATFDPITQMATRDEALLEGLLADLRQTDMIQADERLNALLHQVAADAGVAYGEYAAAGDPGAQLDRAEALREQWGTARGQVWEIPSATVAGRAHHVMCGDSTNAEDVERLMGGKKAALIVTSPPYNQHIDQFSPSGMHKEGHWVSKVEQLAYKDSKPEDEYQAEQSKGLQLWFGIVKDCGSLFYNHKNRYRGKRVVSPLAWLPGPFNLRQEIIWSRPGSVTQNARMFLPSDERIYWLYKGDDFFFNDTTDIKSWSTVWNIGLEINKDHAVGFPVELPKRCISACSVLGDLTVDVYAGSGTTIVAAEQTGRIAYGLDIEPKYVGVCLQRLADMGLSPARVE